MASFYYNSSTYLGHLSIQFHILVIILLGYICQILYGTQDVSIKEPNHFQSLQLILFNLLPAQVLFL